MKIRPNTTRRLWSVLAGERDELVSRSQTGQQNEALRAAWAGYYADRGLLLLTFGWLGLRIYNWSHIAARPEAIYEPLNWMGKLLFPTLPSTLVWGAIAAGAFLCAATCLLKPRSLAPRIVLTMSLLVIIVPEFGFGHVPHVNHLFLLGHVYATFRPMGRPRDAAEAEPRANGYTWYLLGLLAVYTASGLWKVVDMTIRDVLKPGVTWLDPEGMLASTITQMRMVDLPMIVPQYVEAIAWVFPIGYVILTLIFTASFLGAFRRPLLLIIAPTVMLFHLLNAIFTLYALFLSTIVVAGVLLAPYDYIVPAIKRKLVPVRSVSFSGSGGNAQYHREYRNGDTDTFRSFYAYRERLSDWSTLLAAPLYFPGIAWISNHLLDRRTSTVRRGV